MACNCNKAKTPPKGMKASTASAQPAPPPPSQPRPDAPKGATQSFALFVGSSRIEDYGSRLEADAARVRLGQGRVVPVA
jgi:hypothetical protein